MYSGCVVGVLRRLPVFENEQKTHVCDVEVKTVKQVLFSKWILFLSF